jgi:hypothetical protein
MPMLTKIFAKASIEDLRKHKDELFHELKSRLFSNLIACRIRRPVNLSEFARIHISAFSHASGNIWKQELILLKNGIPVAKADQPDAAWNYRMSYFRKMMRIVMAWLVPIICDARTRYERCLEELDAVD